MSEEFIRALPQLLTAVEQGRGLVVEFFGNVVRVSGSSGVVAAGDGARVGEALAKGGWRALAGVVGSSAGVSAGATLGGDDVEGGAGGFGCDGSSGDVGESAVGCGGEAAASATPADDVGVGSREGHGAGECVRGVDCAEGGLGGQSVLTGRARRQAKRREARKKARVEASVAKVVDGEGVSAVAGNAGVGSGCTEVPLWRKKSPSAGCHSSFFSGCSDDTRRRLAESRARALIAQNEVAARRSEALLKSQLVERRVEASRLAVDLKVRNSYEQVFGDGGTGFAETVVSAGLESVIPTPSMSSGSVSPDSSVSVAAVRKMEELLKRQAEENAELRRKNGALESSVREKSTGAEAESRKWKSPFEIERENYEYMDQRFAEMEKQGSILSYTEYCNRFYEGGAGPTPGYTMKPDGIAYHIP